MTATEPVIEPVITTRRNEGSRSRSWPDRLAAMQERWPSTVHDRDQMRETLGDYDLLGRVMRDILRVGYEPPRRGQRSPLEWSDGRARLRSLAAERAGVATNRPFPEAFTQLVADNTLDSISARTGISRTVVHRLMQGKLVATPAEMEKVADTFAKPATYFLEYRIHLICAAIADQLTSSPERTVDVLIRLGAHPNFDD